MKKIWLLLAAMGLLLTACGAPAPVQPSSQPETTVETGAEIESETAAPVTEPAASDTLVLYFSATGNTRRVAQTLAEITDADLLELQPAQPYTDADLDYHDDNCRANREMQDDTARPELSGDLGDLASYGTIYLGYPIWWGTAPRIIETLLDQYDLSGSTIYLFCTSGSSGIEQSRSDLETAYPDLHIAGARRFSAQADAAELQDWVADRNEEN